MLIVMKSKNSESKKKGGKNKKAPNAISGKQRAMVRYAPVAGLIFLSLISVLTYKFTSNNQISNQNDVDEYGVRFLSDSIPAPIAKPYW